MVSADGILIEARKLHTPFDAVSIPVVLTSWQVIKLALGLPVMLEFRVTGSAAAEDKIRNLDPNDLARQTEVIHQMEKECPQYAKLRRGNRGEY